MSPAALSLLMLLGAAAPADTFDLTKIERKIAREPKLLGPPKYLLAVFGPKAETKVWLLFDGDDLYFSGDGSDDLAAPNRRAPAPLVQTAEPGLSQAVWANLPILEKDGKTRHRLTVTQQRPSGKLMLRAEGPRIQETGGIDDGNLLAADKPGAAPIVHFGGPLVAVPGARSWPNTVLARLGAAAADGILNLQVKLATLGLGQGTSACLNPALYSSLALNGSETLGPGGIQAEIDWPVEQGRPAVAETHRLSLTCCSGFYTATLRVPPEARGGKGRITFTFPGSSPGLVAPKRSVLEVK